MRDHCGTRIAPEERRRHGTAAHQSPRRTNGGQGKAEEILPYPHPNIRIVKTRSGSTVTTKVNTLHLDGLG
ncbi:hypothetical protein [Defluviimonas sp. SAOS-178_SWC]|uniref:hypothetical protein n=1 Tax=Defluviimonas sp. SAOS-178_SWC TaxID=3121287 RepID=UPI0032220DD4